MPLFQLIFSLLSAIITIYTIFCVIDILLSWFPNGKNSTFGRFLATICDPYLNLFSKIKFLRFGNIDFSPIISIGILSLLSSILAEITNSPQLYIGRIIGSIIQMIWSVISMFLTIIGILAFVRWLLLARNKSTSNQFWYQVDNFLQNIAYKISKPFSRGVISYKQALLITWIFIIVILIAGSIIQMTLTGLLFSLKI